MTDFEEDSRFPEESQVMVRYPLPGQGPETDREAWAWLPGTVEAVCGPDEWQICVEHESVSWMEGGEKWFPLCFRDASEIRPGWDPQFAADAEAQA